MNDLGGSLEKLKIIGYKDAELKEPIGGGAGLEKLTAGVFIALINPASISLSYSTNFVDKKDGSLTPEATYTGGNPPVLSFDLVLDGTGALANAAVSNAVSLAAQIEYFKNACYYYVSTEHDLPYVQIQWGTALASYKHASFVGRLDSFKINYTLFSSLGIPLRAKLSASFKGTQDPVSGFKMLNTSSPDLTHLITIKAGDTLPMLCKKIYNNAQMYHQIAKINKLNNFRDLKPGLQLEFPPIKQI